MRLLILWQPVQSAAALNCSTCSTYHKRTEHPVSMARHQGCSLIFQTFRPCLPTDPRSSSISEALILYGVYKMTLRRPSRTVTSTLKIRMRTSAVPTTSHQPFLPVSACLTMISDSLPVTTVGLRWLSSHVMAEHSKDICRSQ